MFEKFKRAIMGMYGAAMCGDVKLAKSIGESYLDEVKQDKNAFAGILVASIMAVVIGSVMLYIGLFVSVTVYNAIPNGSLTAADNTTLAGIKTNVNTAFTILGIIMIVGGAAGIIAVLLGMAGGRGVGR